MIEHAVVVAGGGPTGMMLAAELALAGVDVVIVERRLTQELDGSRAGGLHARTIEVLDQRGVAGRFLAEGQTAQVQAYAGMTLDISDFPTRHNYGLALWQSHFERIMAGWVDELGIPVLRGCEVSGFAQDPTGVDVVISGSETVRAEFLVGCDGGRSVVRKAGGIEFDGLDPTTSWMIAEVEMDEEPEFGFRRDSAGTHAIGRRQPDELIRIVLTERDPNQTGEPTMDDLRAALIGVYGTDFSLRRASWISRFTDMSRQATRYRSGRVFVAGDAAHIHPPQGGQGLNTGVQDAVNLAWKLAQVIDRTSSDDLLDSYHDERHPVGARVLHNTMAAVALSRPDERHEALREIVGDLLTIDAARARIAGMLSGLDIHYDLGEGHPLLGWRMPDLDLETSAGPTTVFSLLHTARPVLLDLGPAGFDVSPWPRVRLVQATHSGPWLLPVVGEVPSADAVLIRPDGHVAWAGSTGDPALPAAMSRWFGSNGAP